MAEYVTQEDDWPWRVRAWQERVLDGPPKLPYLHMTEIRSRRWRDEHGISFDDAEERVSEAIRLLRSIGSVSAVGSVVERAHIADIIHPRFKAKKRVPAGLDEPDYFCFIAYATFMVAQVWKKYPDAERVDFVVSRNGKITNRIREFHEPMKVFLDPPLLQLVGNLTPASMEESLPLQAADVLCWHLQRYYSKTMDRLDERRLAMLANDTDGYVHSWEVRDLEQLAERLLARVSEKAGTTAANES